jgi:YggT family protein
VQQVVCALLTTYLIILFARAILSWLPPSSGALATVTRVLMDLTEPVLAPLRRLIPPTGVFDLSFLVLVIGLSIVRQSICG